MPAHSDRQTFKNEDLILRVSPSIDPKIWDENKYDAFIDELCSNRVYQKEAIFTTLRYLLGKKYSSLKNLAEENYKKNDELEKRYGSWKGMESHLQFPEKISCSIDMATGTGKSYVMYGLATILLAEGVVDRVLILCPSNTIEAGLTSKFKSLASNADLRDLLPSDSKINTPRIINASETIVEGSICIENYHAILQHVKSSIRDSLIGRGSRVAIFNDEAHHVANESGSTNKKWKEFLLNSEYDFKYVVGVSGTCYVNDDYFSDVVYRYSLSKAIEERYVKKVQYVSEMPQTDNPDEKWQLIFKRHQSWKNDLKKKNIRPITIIVTRDIKTCDLVAEQLKGFLKEWEKISQENADKKVLAVSSAAEHQVNISKLKTVDRPESQVEWIVSVSMLNEGWDVKNVFQIVPHEERAFNSKLLIAQVLGRGLRVPDNWKGQQPTVTVFNHDSWSDRIRHLVNEILEIDRRVTSIVLPKSPFNFDLHNLDYNRETDTSNYKMKGEYKLLETGCVDLPSQVEVEKVDIHFEEAVTGTQSKFRTELVHKTYTLEEVAEQMYRRLRSIDDESNGTKDKTNYSKKFPYEKCLEIMKASANKAKIKTGKFTEDNRQKILQALGPLHRKEAKRVVYKLKPKALTFINTKERINVSCSAMELRRGDKTVFYTPETEKEIPDDQLEFFNELKDADGEYRNGVKYISNAFDFKTPTNLAIADANNERRFIGALCDRENSKHIDSWIKNSSQRFYSIEYAWKKGEHPKRGEFSPDFFIKKKNVIYVVEIKDDSEIKEPSPENKKKYEYAVQHFERLNQWLEKKKLKINYQICFLTPKSFNTFLNVLQDDKKTSFRSDLDVELAKKEDL